MAAWRRWRVKVSQQVSVIVASASINAAKAAQAATAAIPIVFAIGAGPVRIGLVASLNHPGGNISGITFLADELGPKRLELLHELVPEATRFGFLVNPAGTTAELNIRGMQAAAQRLGCQLFVVSVGSAKEIDDAFAEFNRERVAGIVPTEPDHWARG